MSASVTVLFPNATGREIKYILNKEGKPMPISNTLQWAHWMEANRENCTTAYTQGDIRVSTIFLGMDKASKEKSPPVLWETIVFCERRPELADEFQWRYATKEEAQRMHKVLSDTVRSTTSLRALIHRLEELYT